MLRAMKRLAAILLVASLSTACTGLGKTGTRGPQIGRTSTEQTVDQPAHHDAAQREIELGQR